VADNGPLVFVSYETNTGLVYAKLAKARLNVAGYSAWVWHDDRRTGAYTHEEIADKIAECHHFVYICTKDSHGSRGQKYERGTALALNKVPFVITVDRAYVSPVLATHNLVETTTENFERDCDKLAAELSAQQKISRPVAEYGQEGEPIEPA
jgi:hypothetical protein